ncbi:MAG: tRNA (adenosine(37)-N6)-threonylcarbamoyltransferase complex dimerization subunit type 1 TsaB, partial [Terrimesophilobacter sp.]
MLLAIDTAAGTSVAVVESGNVLSVHSVEDTRRHAEVIGDLIQRSLADARAEVSDLTGVAVGMGPGPFTGLRVGIAAAEAFANGAGLPLLRVASHDAVAFQHADADPEASHGSAGLLITTDARRQERYWSAYQGVDLNGIPHRVAGPEIGRAEIADT